MSIYSRGMSEELLPSLEKKFQLQKGQSNRHIFKARVVNHFCLFGHTCIIVNVFISLSLSEGLITSFRTYENKAFLLNSTCVSLKLNIYFVALATSKKLHIYSCLRPYNI